MPWKQSSQESDYTTMFIPYGPKWDRERTRRHVLDYVSSANSWYYRLNVSGVVYLSCTAVVYCCRVSG